MSTLIEHGLYKIRDQYFSDFKGSWSDNKNERRPYYYLFEDKDGIPWMIPLSTQVSNYKQKMLNIEAQRGKGNCIYYHFGPIASIERVFLIGDMFPVDIQYIKGPFIINSQQYICRDKALNRAIYSKAMRYLNLVETGVMKNRYDILGIKHTLLEKRNRK